MKHGLATMRLSQIEHARHIDRRGSISIGDNAIRSTVGAGNLDPIGRIAPRVGCRVDNVENIIILLRAVNVAAAHPQRSRAHCGKVDRFVNLQRYNGCIFVLDVTQVSYL